MDVNLGGVTDSYQAIEEEMKIMPEVLKVLIKHPNPAIISTKSKLILRDYDRIAKLAKLTHFKSIYFTVTDFAKFLGLSILLPNSNDKKYDIN